MFIIEEGCQHCNNDVIIVTVKENNEDIVSHGACQCCMRTTILQNENIDWYIRNNLVRRI